MTWTELKQYIDRVELLKFIELDHRYDVWWELGNRKFECEVYKEDPANDDQLDFETNYKPHGNHSSSSAFDNLGRWVVRAESRRDDWDTCFQGSGDDPTNQIIGGGQPFLFDFSAAVEDPRWVAEPPTGYKQQSIKWTFMDPTYVKEGTVYFFDVPKGSYMDFYIAVTQGYPYSVKNYDANLDVIRTISYCTVPYLRFQNWVSHYHIEGSCSMGDELNTESAAEFPAYPFHVFETVITVPEVTGWESSHGHWSFELYRPRTVIL